MTKSPNEGAIFGICNPLLDISTNVDMAFLEKYNLKANSAILGDDEHLEIYDDINQKHLSEVEHTPGGSAQNALRTAAWILKQPNVATFMGCVGEDQNAQIMRQKCAEVGLNAVYQVDASKATGTCAVLITGKERSLVAHLAAANHFTVDHLENDHHWSYIEKAQIIYVSGFFFTVSPPSIMKLAKFALENNRDFAVNLSAPFLSQFFKEPIQAALPYVDDVFGNEDEAKAFSANILGKETNDIHEIARAIAQLPKLNANKKRTVVITQGGEPVVYTVGGDEIKELPVPRIDPAKIIDTNGAGDAFVGGWLAQYAKGASLEKCIDCGIWVSGVIIQRSGCTFPDEMTYE
jgi:adenosine kinase